MKKLFLCNLGCSKNFVDGDTIAGFLVKNGFETTQNAAVADAIIVNTCSFIEQATQEAINTILEYASQKKVGSEFIVSGCFSQRYKSKVEKNFPEVDLWLSTQNWREELKKFYNFQDITKGFERILSEPIHTQYLKISDGCSHKCSFCVIPQIKGDFKSEPMEKIVKEAQILEEKGVKEIIIVSQDTSFYGRDIGVNLTVLLKTLLEATNFRWIRTMYLHPNFVDDEFLDFIAGNSRICPYFDIPLQHICDEILKSMGRKPKKSELYKLIEKIRKKVPNATIRSSFIIGYPNENLKDFKELCEFVKWAEFDKLGVFPYSPEEGAKAAKLSNRPANKTVQKRITTIMEIQREISRKKQEAKIGQKIEIIVDGVSEFPEYNFECRSVGDAPEVDGKVFLTDGDAAVGDFVEAEIVDCDDYDLFAKFVKKV
ncbi:MAG: 30S ribosomal protein S12 methylthiotransferase RimO [Chitinispirillales bacterium]|jgi:ribosomal protein S12 methylthiotransferase|nr:30S ribosomal protein S12 methylthiotransferase RimO [Chitinispirillales bacterium]